MTASISFDNTCRPIVGIDPDELDHGTPLDHLREGEMWANDSFHRWIKDPLREQELEELLTGHPMHARATLEGLQQEWSNRVAKGEW